MVIAASPVPLSFPGTSDLVGILPELVLGGAFVLLMLLDLVIPASRRSWLAGFALAMCLVGLLDDAVDLLPRHKFILELAAIGGA